MKNEVRSQWNFNRCQHKTNTNTPSEKKYQATSGVQYAEISYVCLDIPCMYAHCKLYTSCPEHLSSPGIKGIEMLWGENRKWKGWQLPGVEPSTYRGLWGLVVVRLWGWWLSSCHGSVTEHWRLSQSCPFWKPLDSTMDNNGCRQAEENVVKSFNWVPETNCIQKQTWSRLLYTWSQNLKKLCSH